MKRIFCVMLSLATTAVFAGSIFSTPLAPIVDENIENQIVYVSQGLKLAPKHYEESNKDQASTINATYPRIIGEELSTSAHLFNKKVLALVNEEINKYKKYVANDMSHMQSLPEEARQNTLRIDYDIDVVRMTENTIISVRLSTEGSQAGRAHPYHNHRVLNFDLAKGKVLTLASLFKPGSQYIKVIAKFCNKTLNEKLEDKTFIENGTKPVEKNFKNWNLENDGILFTFDEYQVASYIYGAQEVEIPYEALKDIISIKAPIFPCVQNPAACIESKIN